MKHNTSRQHDLSQTRIGQAIVEEMDRCGMSIKDLSRRLTVSYEHARRIVRGECVPSNLALRMICQELGLDLGKIDRLATADRIKHKYGKVPAEISGKKPSLEPLERVWDQLLVGQQEDLIAMAHSWYQRNHMGVNINPASPSPGGTIGQIEVRGADEKAYTEVVGNQRA
jgi:transcriptional regulator with XRE-family HTH domain